MESDHENTRAMLKYLINNPKIDISLFFNILNGKLPKPLCKCLYCRKMLKIYAYVYYNDESFADSVISSIELGLSFNTELVLTPQQQQEYEDYLALSPHSEESESEDSESEM